MVHCYNMVQSLWDENQLTVLEFSCTVLLCALNFPPHSPATKVIKDNLLTDSVWAFYVNIHAVSISQPDGSIYLWLTPTMKVKMCGGWEGQGKNRGAVNSFSDKGQGRVWAWSKLKHTKKCFIGSWSRQEIVMENIRLPKAASCVCYPTLFFLLFKVISWYNISFIFYCGKKYM